MNNRLPDDYPATIATAEQLQLQTKHFRVVNIYGGLTIANYGGLTITYFRPKNNKTIRLSVAVCSDKDQFDKKMGRYLAIKKFVENKNIILPISKEENTVDFLNRTFQNYTQLVFG